MAEGVPQDKNLKKPEPVEQPVVTPVETDEPVELRLEEDDAPVFKQEPELKDEKAANDPVFDEDKEIPEKFDIAEQLTELVDEAPPLPDDELTQAEIDSMLAHNDAYSGSGMGAQTKRLYAELSDSGNYKNVPGTPRDNSEENSRKDRRVLDEVMAVNAMSAAAQAAYNNFQRFLDDEVDNSQARINALDSQMVTVQGNIDLASRLEASRIALSETSAALAEAQTNKAGIESSLADMRTKIDAFWANEAPQLQQAVDEAKANLDAASENTIKVDGYLVYKDGDRYYISMPDNGGLTRFYVDQDMDSEALMEKIREEEALGKIPGTDATRQLEEIYSVANNDFSRRFGALASDNQDFHNAMFYQEQAIQQLEDKYSVLEKEVADLREQARAAGIDPDSDLSKYIADQEARLVDLKAQLQEEKNYLADAQKLSAYIKSDDYRQKYANAVDGNVVDQQELDELIENVPERFRERLVQDLRNSGIQVTGELPVSTAALTASTLSNDKAEVQAAYNEASALLAETVAAREVASNELKEFYQEHSEAYREIRAAQSDIKSLQMGMKPGEFSIENMTPGYITYDPMTTGFNIGLPSFGNDYTVYQGWGRDGQAQYYYISPESGDKVEIKDSLAIAEFEKQKEWYGKKFGDSEIRAAERREFEAYRKFDDVSEAGRQLDRTLERQDQLIERLDTTIAGLKERIETLEKRAASDQSLSGYITEQKKLLEDLSNMRDQEANYAADLREFREYTSSPEYEQAYKDAISNDGKISQAELDRLTEKMPERLKADYIQNLKDQNLLDASVAVENRTAYTAGQTSAASGMETPGEEWPKGGSNLSSTFASASKPADGAPSSDPGNNYDSANDPVYKTTGTGLNA